MNKKLIGCLLLLLPLTAAAGTMVPADTARRGKAEEVIWASEIAYFTRLYKADHQGVLLFTDSLFTAWPAAAEKPLNREQSLQFMKKYFPTPTGCRCTIKKDAITVTGDMAMTHFRVLSSCPDKNGVFQTQMTRINHVWIRRGNLWRLLGGSGGIAVDVDKEQ